MNHLYFTIYSYATMTLHSHFATLILYYDCINDIQSGESGFGGEFHTTTGGFYLHVECGGAAPCYAESWMDVTD